MGCSLESLEIVCRFLLVSPGNERDLGGVTGYHTRKELHDIITENGLRGAYTGQKGCKSGAGTDLLMRVSHYERPLKITKLDHALGTGRGSAALSTEKAPGIEAH